MLRSIGLPLLLPGATLPLATADVVGYVKSTTGTGLGGLRVNILQSSNPNSAGGDAWQWVAGATTDANGRYTVGGLPARTYHLRAEGGAATGGQRYLPVDLYNVVVQQTTQAFPDLVTRQAGYLYGYVRDSDDQPIEDAEVLVEAQFASDSDNDWHQARTDASGYYEVPLAPTDKAIYPIKVLRASRGTIHFAVQIAPDLYAARLSGTRGPDFRLIQGGTLHGYVTTSSGQPLSVNTDVLEPAAQIPGGVFEDPNVSPDANGELWLHGVPAGTDVWLDSNAWSRFEISGTRYMWGERSVGPFRVTAGQVRDVPSLYMPQAGTLKVTVRDAGNNTLADARVKLGGYDVFGGSFDFDGDELSTDSQGQCLFDAVPPGQYRIRAAKPGRTSSVSGWLTVVSGQETTTSAVLATAAGTCTVTGRIGNFADVAPKNGQDVLPFNTMDSYDDYGRPSEIGLFSYAPTLSWTDENLLWPDLLFNGFAEIEDGYDDYFVPNSNGGTFSARDLPSGPQGLCLYRNVPATAPLGWSVLLSDPVAVNGTPGGTVGPLLITAPTGTGTVSGTVAFPAGYTPDLARSRTMIYLRPTGVTSGLGRALAEPGPSLAYGLTNLPEGSYYLYAVAVGMAPYTSPQFNLAAGGSVIRDIPFASAAANLTPIIDSPVADQSIPSAEEGAPFAFPVLAHDPNPTDSLRYSWWTRTGPTAAWTQVMLREDDPLSTPVWAGTIPYEAVRHPDISHTNYQIKVVARDNYGAEAARTWTVQTLNDTNRPPSQQGQTATLTGGTTKSEPITCTLSQPAMDPDAEDTVSYTFEWQHAARQTVIHIGTGLTDVLAAANLAKGQTWTCTVTAKDQLGGTSPSPVASNAIVVGNSVPVVVDSNRTVGMGETLTVPEPGVLQGATDADSDPLTAMRGDGPNAGWLTLSADGSYQYTPNPGFSGQDHFAFRAFDGIAPSNVGTVTISVTDTTPPAIVSLSPLDNDAAVAPFANLVIVFTENVFGGTGAVRILRANGVLIEAIPVGDVRIAIQGNIVAIDPATTLANASAYCVQIDPTCFRDGAGNYFAGIADTTTWNFATAPGEDQDHDGLDDAWERDFFGGLQAGPDEDPDGDGVTNRDEYASGADPLGYDLDLEPGWNLVAVARPPVNRAVSAVLVDAQGQPAILGQVWVWDAAETRYTPVTSIEPLRGHWVFAPRKVRVHIAPPPLR